MKNKLFVSLVIGAFLLVIFSSFVMAATTVSLVSPAADSTIAGTTVLNATVTNVAGNFTCEFYAKSSSTANNTWTLLVTRANTTDTDANATFNSAILEDSNDYIFNVTCSNDTDTWAGDTNNRITVDNTIPQAPTSLSPSTDSIDTDGTVTFSATVVGENTTSCTLYFVEGNPGDSSYTMTHSGDTCTYTLSSIPEQSYKWYVQASDGTNTTNSATSRIIVDVKTSAGKLAVLSQAEKKGLVRRTGAKTFTVVETIGDGLNDMVGPFPLWIWLIIIGVVLITIASTKRRR